MRLGRTWTFLIVAQVAFVVASCQPWSTRRGFHARLECRIGFSGGAVHLREVADGSRHGSVYRAAGRPRIRSAPRRAAERPAASSRRRTWRRRGHVRCLAARRGEPGRGRCRRQLESRGIRRALDPRRHLLLRCLRSSDRRGPRAQRARYRRLRARCDREPHVRRAALAKPTRIGRRIRYEKADRPALV